MNIRPAIDSDIPELLSMIKRHDESIYRARLQEMKRGESVQLVAEEDGKIIGQAFLAFYGKATYPQYPDIRDVHVVDGRRSQGLGSELMHVCEHLAMQRGFNRIGLAVNPKLNPRARRLYERLGYVSTDDEPYLDGVYDGVEEWVIDMVKKLAVTYSD